MTDSVQIAGRAEADGLKTCQVQMQDGTPCGRPRLGPVFDLGPYCLMHASGSKDDAAFQGEFERIVNEAGTGVADFTGFVFPTANYAGRRFEPYCVFSGATFAESAEFRGATFARGASFIGSTFAKRAGFWNAVFARDATFSATFTEKAGFSGAVFQQDAEFTFCTFAQGAIFNGTKFERVANFSRASFLESAEFRETLFRKDRERVPGPRFSLVDFSHPEAVIFYKTNLGQALFHNCDVSKLNFSSVEWSRRRNGKRMVFEEVIALDDRSAEPLRPRGSNPDERDYGLIAELYQQLKKNYDKRKDYWTAGDFHYGEMEMKRLHSQGKSGWTRWLSQNLGLVAWYKYASQYGESYIRPAVVLSIILVIFTFLFPWAGLDRNEDAPHSAAAEHQQAPAALSKLTYRHFNDFIGAYPGRRVGTAAFFGNSLMTALSVAGFQKELKYEPSYPWGRALALLELLLTSTLAALFLLAVRRQFKR